VSNEIFIFFCLSRHAGNHDTTAGVVLSFFIALVGTVGATLIISSYYIIKNEIKKRQDILNTISVGHLRRRKSYSTATDCLTTYILIAVFIYTPLAILSWIYAIASWAGYIEPINVYLITTIACSSGWANSWGYFYNEKLRCLNNNVK